jgi:hypothetical protein
MPQRRSNVSGCVAYGMIWYGAIAAFGGALAQTPSAMPPTTQLGLGDLIANSVSLSAFAITCCIAYLSLPQHRFQEQLQRVARRFLATVISTPADFGTKWCPVPENRRQAHHVILSAFLRIGDIVDWTDHGLTQRELDESHLTAIAFLFCHGHDNTGVFVAATSSFLTLLLSFLFLFDAINAIPLPGTLGAHLRIFLVIVYSVNFAVILSLAVLTLARSIALWRMRGKIRWARNELRIQMRNDSARDFQEATQILSSHNRERR